MTLRDLDEFVAIYLPIIPNQLFSLSFSLSLCSRRRKEKGIISSIQAGRREARREKNVSPSYSDLNIRIRWGYILER